MACDGVLLLLMALCSMGQESEARLDRLRKKKKKGEGDEGEHALERQLTGSSKEVEQLTNDTMIVRPPEKVKEVKKRGHINFWEEFEGDASSVSSSTAISSAYADYARTGQDGGTEPRGEIGKAVRERKD